MMPASTLKVVTLAAAAERLGWDYSYETRIVADGRVAGDTSTATSSSSRAATPV